MADSIDFSLIGVDALLAKFAAVTYDVKRKGGRSSLRKAAKLVADKLKENALKIDDPETAANIAANVDLRWSNRTYKATGDLKFRVGILGGAGGRAKSEALSSLPGGDTRHWRLVEFGTEKMRANPFMRKALADNISEITDKFLTEYEKSLDRAIKRATKNITAR